MFGEACIRWPVDVPVVGCSADCELQPTQMAVAHSPGNCGESACNHQHLVSLLCMTAHQADTPLPRCGPICRSAPDASQTGRAPSRLHRPGFVGGSCRSSGLSARCWIRGVGRPRPRGREPMVGAEVRCQKHCTRSRLLGGRADGSDRPQAAMLTGNDQINVLTSHRWPTCAARSGCTRLRR